MIKTAKITSKGQISLPKEIRNVFKGDRVAVVAYEDRVEIMELSKLGKNMGNAYASESMLAKEWKTKEEEETWKDL